jgi:hypothetical protein
LFLFLFGHVALGGQCLVALDALHVARVLVRRLGVVAVELCRRDRAVVTVLAHELLVRPHLHDPPAVHDDDEVGRPHRAKPVGDDERRPPVHREPHPAPDQIFRPRVDRGRRVVEDEDARVGQYRPRDRHALPLPTRQAAAALAEHGLVSLRQLFDELVRLREPRRRFHFTAFDARPAVGDVRLDRVAEQVRLLEHERHLLADRVERRVRDIHPVDRDPPPLRVVEPRQQVDERALARPGRPDERDDGPALHLERDVLDHRPVRVVPERHAVELHRAGAGRELAGVRPFRHGRWGHQHLVQPPGRHDRVLVLLVDLRDLLQPPEDRRHRRLQDEEVADVQPLEDDEDRDREHQRQVRDARDATDDRVEVREHPDAGPDLGVKVVAVDVVLLDLDPLRRERLDDVNAGDVLGDQRRVAVTRVHRRLGHRLHPLAEPQDVPRPQGQRHERQRRQPRAAAGQEDHEPRDDQHDLQRRQQRRLRERAHVLQIAERPVDELPARQRVVKPEAHPLNLVVHGLADVVDHVHGELGVGHFADVSQDRPGQDQPDEDADRVSHERRTGLRVPGPCPETVGDRPNSVNQLKLLNDVRDVADGLRDQDFGEDAEGQVDARQDREPLHRFDEPEDPDEQFLVRDVGDLGPDEVCDLGGAPGDRGRTVGRPSVGAGRCVGRRLRRRRLRRAGRVGNGCLTHGPQTLQGMGRYANVTGRLVNSPNPISTHETAISYKPKSLTGNCLRITTAKGQSREEMRSRVRGALLLARFALRDFAVKT